MSETVTATSGATSTSSGVDVKSTTLGDEQATLTGGDDARTYPAHFVDKIKKEKENLSKAFNDLKAEVEGLKSQQVQGVEDELAKNQKYKELWETEKQKRELSEQQLTTARGRMTEARKLSAIKTELLKLGLNPEHEKTVYRLIDHTTVFEDEQTGVMVGAEDAARTFFDQHKTLGFFGRSGPGVDQRAPLGRSAQTARKSFSEMSKEELADEYRKLV